jgi:hypothetical protein
MPGEGAGALTREVPPGLASSVVADSGLVFGPLSSPSGDGKGKGADVLSSPEQPPLPIGEENAEVEPPHFTPAWSRWYGPGNPQGLLEPPPYPEVNERASPFNPYRQNILKGDFPIHDPIFGTKDLFFNVIVTDRINSQYRKLPTQTGITGPLAFRENHFGDGKQRFVSNDLAITMELFQGQQAFRPVKWRLRATPVINYNYTRVRETGAINIDVSRGITRRDSHVALQEGLFEYHLHDWNDRFDFLSVEGGILPFRSDFRGFIFDDSNLGVRLLGNADENKWQYNLVYFDMLDKDTNSGLNKFDNREQQVWIANVYRQDFLTKGYTTSFSFHYNDDHRDTHFDDNGRLVAPAPVGSADEHDVTSYYGGWAGEGHLGRIGITHALYHAWGRDSKNPLAGRRTRIDAQLAALELSYDVDWLRYRVFGLYASGDSNARDGEAEGFDAILDAPNFAGGEFSFFNSQAIQLLGVNLTNGLSPLPDLQTNKNEGQSNFVNPGLLLTGGAIDYEISPTMRGQVGGSYLRFMETDSLEVFLELPRVEKEIGLEFFTSLQWRPLLTNNIIFNVGASALIPGDGLERIYQSSETLYAVFFNTILTW